MGLQRKEQPEESVRGWWNNLGQEDTLVRRTYGYPDQVREERKARLQNHTSGFHRTSASLALRAKS